MNGQPYHTREFPSQLLDPHKPYILWLASWYPSKTVPYNGDFIQRHAYAASAFHNILVVHTIHDPACADEILYHVNDQNNIKEVIIYFRDTDPVDGWIHKLQYNIRYYHVCKQFISQLFSRSSLPLFIHVHIPMKMGRLALWIKRKWGLPYVVSEHSASYINNAPDYFFNRNFYYRLSVHHVFRNGIAVTNVSIAIADILKKIFRLQHIYIIRNTVDERLFHFRETKHESFRFIHVSTMTHQKNIEGLISIFELLYSQKPEVELLLVGPVTKEIKQQISDSPARQAIQFTGELPYAEVAMRMQESNCFILFSRYENFPCVIIEALCCGLPVITSNAGGAAEGINNKNGIIVSCEDHKAMLSAMKTILENYQHYDRKQISELAMANYSFPVIGQNISNFYRDLGLIKKTW